MRLRADIRRDGITRHLVAETRTGNFLPVEQPVVAEILEKDGAAFLLRLNSHGVCVADTWHEDVAAARAQASFEYGIEEGDWSAVA